jgi:hypothetical protein
MKLNLPGKKQPPAGVTRRRAGRISWATSEIVQILPENVTQRMRAHNVGRVDASVTVPKSESATQVADPASQAVVYGLRSVLKIRRPAKNNTANLRLFITESLPKTPHRRQLLFRKLKLPMSDLRPDGLSYD